MSDIRVRRKHRSPIVFEPCQSLDTSRRVNLDFAITTSKRSSLLPPLVLRPTFGLLDFLAIRSAIALVDATHTLLLSIALSWRWRWGVKLGETLVDFFQETRVVCLQRKIALDKQAGLAGRRIDAWSFLGQQLGYVLLKCPSRAVNVCEKLSSTGTSAPPS